MRIVSGGTSSELYGGRFTGTVRLEMLDEAPDGSAPCVVLRGTHTHTPPLAI